MRTMEYTFDQQAATAIIGHTGEARVHVTDAVTAASLGSGDLPVLGTPRLVALMEEAAFTAMLSRIPPAFTTVGTQLDVRHRAPSPVGSDVIAHAQVVDASGARLTFSVWAEHEYQGQVVEVGRGTHVRVVVDRQQFIDRL